MQTSTIYENSMTMAAPGVSIGDIDGDGDNEIVVAGFLNKSTESDRVNLQKGNVGFTYYEVVGTSIKQTGGLQTLTDISAISKGDSLRNKERLWQQFSVECVSFGGVGQKEYIFLNGWVYQMEENSGSLTPKKVKVTDSGTLGGVELFAKLTTEIKQLDHKYDINEVYIMSASTANFSGDTSGRESLFLTVGYHMNPDKNKDSYLVGQLIITAKDDGTLQSKFVNDNDRTNTSALKDGVSFDNYVTITTGANNFSYICVAVDIDYDSLVVKYDHTEAFYSAPTVVAFLQAAPYYSELDAGNSSTTYSYTEGYEQSTTEGFDIAVGFGIAAEVETSCAKFETEEEWRTGLTEEFTRSTAVEYTTTFEASDQNQVILRRTAMYTYYYSVLAADGSFTNAGGNNQNLLAVTVPKYPVVSALSVDQYNAYVDTFNEKCSSYTSGESWVSWVDTVSAKYGKDATKIFFGSSSMRKITPELMEKYYLNNEGDPYSYASGVGDYLNGFSMVKDNTWVTLSWASGTISQEMNTTLSYEQSTTTSIGVSVSMRLMGGASFAGNGAWAGVTASLESSVSNTQTTSEILSTGTSGTVQGLSADQSAFDFDW